MKQYKWLTRIIAVMLLTLLVCAGAGYATEYYQGRGNLEIISEYNGFDSMYTTIIMSNGEINATQTQNPDGSTSVDISTEGTYNSVRELTTWADTSVSVTGTTESVDVVDTDKMEATGLGTYIHNAAANEKLERHETIFLHNGYQ